MLRRSTCPVQVSDLPPRLEAILAPGESHAKRPVSGNRVRPGRMRPGFGREDPTRAVPVEREFPLLTVIASSIGRAARDHEDRGSPLAKRSFRCRVSSIAIAFRR